MDQAAVRITLSASSNAPTYTGGPFTSGVAQMNTRRTVAGWGSEWVISVGAFGESVDLSLGGNYAQLSSSSLTIAAGTWWASLRGAGGAVEGSLVEIGTLTTAGVFTVMWTGYATAVSCDGLALTVEVESALSRRHKTVPIASNYNGTLAIAPLVYGYDVDCKLTSVGMGKSYIDVGASATTYHYDRALPNNYTWTHFPGGDYVTAKIEKTRLRFTDNDDNIKANAVASAGSVYITRELLNVVQYMMLDYADPLPRLSAIDTPFDWESKIASGRIYAEIGDTTKTYVNITGYTSSGVAAPIEQFGQVAPDPVDPGTFDDIFYDQTFSTADGRNTGVSRYFSYFPSTATASGEVKIFEADTAIASDTDTFTLTMDNGLQIPFEEVSAGSKMWRPWNYALGNLSMYACPWVGCVALSGNDLTVLSDGRSDTNYQITAYANQAEDGAALAKGVFSIPFSALDSSTDVYLLLDLTSTQSVEVSVAYYDQNGHRVTRETISILGSSGTFNNFPESMNYPGGSFSAFSANQKKLTIPDGTANISIFFHPASGTFSAPVSSTITIRQCVMVPVYGTIWDTISTVTQRQANGRTISTAWPSPAATGDTLGDVIDSQRNIILDLYYSQLGLTNSQVDTTSFSAVPYRSASLVLASAQNSDAVIAQLCADADLVGYHTRNGKEAAREMYKYVGTTTYAWTAEALLDSGSIVPQPVNKFAPSPILNASTDWVTGNPQVIAAINDPATTSATLTPTNYLQYAPGYLDYSIAVEAQRLANDGYKRHGLKDRTTINAPTWADAGIAGLDNNWVGSPYAVSRLAWITARKDVYQCEIDADAFPITASVGDHIKITDPYMGDFVGLLCEWSFDAMAETVSLKMICDPQLTQRDIIDVQITHADIINVQITDTSVINVLI